MNASIVKVGTNLGDKILRKKSLLVREIDVATERLIGYMSGALWEHRALGLAAVQVGSLRRIVLVRDSTSDEPKLLINPSLVFLPEGREVGIETCLSIPDVKAEVERRKAVHVIHRTGSFTARDLLARVVQHEVDHLDGILITDRGRILEEAEHEVVSGQDRRES